MVFKSWKSRRALGNRALLSRAGKGKYSKGVPRKTKRFVRTAIKRYERKNIEKKWMHVPFTYNVSNAGQTLQLTSIPQGDTENTRDGRQVMLIGFHLRFSVTLATSPFNCIRVILFQWYGYPVGGSQPLLLDILESADVQAHYAHKSSGQFSILYDRLITTTDNNPHREVVVHIPLTGLGKHRKVEFDQNPASITRHCNGLQLLMLSDDGAVPYPLVQGIAHVTFTDA